MWGTFPPSDWMHLRKVCLEVPQRLLWTLANLFIWFALHFSNVLKQDRTVRSRYKLFLAISHYWGQYQTECDKMNISVFLISMLLFCVETDCVLSRLLHSYMFIPLSWAFCKLNSVRLCEIALLGQEAGTLNPYPKCCGACVGNLAVINAICML